MTQDVQSARDDLAFLRGLVDGGEPLRFRGFAETYFAAGLIYGGQMVLHAVQALGLLPQDGLTGLVIGVGPTAVFAVALTWILLRNRHLGPRGAAGRAVGGVFSAMGLANLALLLVIGWQALRMHSIEVWLIFPCAVFVLQGTAWFFAWTMRRRGWHGLVAGGWYAAAVAMALTIDKPGWFILFGGLGLWLCMALPGWALLRGQAD
jgi:hypothetical protein